MLLSAGAPLVALIDGYVELDPLAPGALAVPSSFAVSSSVSTASTQGVCVQLALVVSVGFAGPTSKHSGLGGSCPDPSSVASFTPFLAVAESGVNTPNQQYRPAEVSFADPDSTVGAALLTLTPTFPSVPFDLTPPLLQTPVAIGPQM